MSVKTAHIGRFHVTVGTAEYERLLANGYTVDRFENVEQHYGDADLEPEVQDNEPTELDENSKREDLNARALELGVEEPDKLPNKGAVLDAIRAKLADES